MSNPTGLKKHGLTNTPTYRSWMAMRRRCNCATHVSFKRYGGRGITVCQRWNEFENFFQDMGKRPAGMTLGRKNHDKGYSKGNCEWQDSATQGYNKSNSHVIEINGQRKSLSEWARITGITPNLAFARIQYGWDEKTAVSTGKIRL